MYTYLYDSFVSDPKYAKILGNIETRITDLGIQGRIDRVSVFKNPKEILKEAIRRKSTTVVIVGNDDTIRKTIEVIPDFDLTFAIIPIGSPNQVTKYLGIPEGELACDTLSARIIEKIDLGRINNKFFFSNVAIPQTSASVRCNESFDVTPEDVGGVYIHNLPFPSDSFEPPVNTSYPCDGILDLYITTPPNSVFGKVKWMLGKSGNISKNRISVIPVKRLDIRAE
ncbi:MAG: diacylglycerol kinase family protein, partial [Patescibacteria group bacterium]|nr:diacylglycerol kinase family protein [Patescibacteria group bacterium]